MTQRIPGVTKPYKTLDIKPQSHRGADLERGMNAFYRRNGEDAQATLVEYDGDIGEHTEWLSGHGVSYRKNNLVLVGATITGFALERGRPKIIINEGYNYSPFKGAPKDCAEIRAIRMGDIRCPLGWTALATRVSGPGSPGLNYQINGIEADTLWLCGSTCAPIVANHPAIPPDMPIRTDARSEPGIVVPSDVHTITELREIYSQISLPLTSFQILEREQSA